ncbi:uncharacterized protein LOC122259990 [Penaeus japonicus]|uniref:uncharacterized protein LOC122259990 n=1 Tax=Penaeus japonicus TaxID=27405 RepID=UPI001C7124A1|nr:uncharacterized protein LOC122259990 [Penaeus japonicus]
MAAQIIAQTDLTSAAQTEEESACNEKKRTTSVTFDLGEGEETTPDLVGEANMQESRKQKWVSQSRLWRTEIDLNPSKAATPQHFIQTRTAAASQSFSALCSSQSQVLKRLSYPLSWMESFSTDKENMPQHQSYQPQSAPPVSSTANSSTDSIDGNKAGMFSNVFNMSNVSNMLSSSPKYLVDFSSGLFARSPSDTTSSVRDVTELGTPPGSLESYRLGHSVFYRKQSSLGSEKDERKGIPIFHPGRPSLDFARRPGSQQPLSVSVQQTQSTATPLAPGALAGNVPTHAQQQQQMGTQVANPQSQKRAQYKEGPKFGLKSMVSMDDMPELFASFDNMCDSMSQFCGDAGSYGGDNWFSSTSLYASSDVCSAGSLSNSNSSSLSGGGVVITLI